MKQAPLLALLIVGCIDFHKDFDDYCASTGRCDGGSTGGGSGGSSGGAQGGGTGGAQGGGTGGGSSGGPGGGSAGGGAAMPCTAELCQIESVVQPDTMFALWGSSKSNVWFAGDALWHYDGGALGAVTNPVTYRTFAIGGSGPGDVWLGGDDLPFMWHLDATGAWRSKLTDAGQYVYGMAGFSPNEQYMITEDKLYRYGGTGNWENLWSNDAGVSLSGVSTAPGAPVWVAGGEHVWRYESGTFTHEDPGVPGQTIETIFVAPEGSVWIVGDTGTLARRPAATGAWEKLTVDVPGHLSEDLWGVWGTSGDDAFIVGGSGALLHWRADAGFSKLDALALDGGVDDVLWFGAAGFGDELWVCGGKHRVSAGVYDAGVIAHFKIGR